VYDEGIQRKAILLDTCIQFSKNVQMKEQQQKTVIITESKRKVLIMKYTEEVLILIGWHLFVIRRDILNSGMLNTLYRQNYVYQEIVYMMLFLIRDIQKDKTVLVNDIRKEKYYEQKCVYIVQYHSRHVLLYSRNRTTAAIWSVQ